VAESGFVKLDTSSLLDSTNCIPVNLMFGTGQTPKAQEVSQLFDEWLLKSRVGATT
jgi:hypothetical protein